MASIRTRTRKDGSEYHTLTWREDNQQRAHSFDTLREAETWKRLLDANGQSMSKAVDLHEAAQEEGPTVAEAMVDHIDQLVGTTPYTIKRYRDAVRLHFSGPLGQMKVKAVTHDSVIEWIKWMQGRDKGPKTISLQHGLLTITVLR